MTRILEGFFDAGVIAGRDIRHWIARPGGVIVGWLFPVMILMMFGGLFGGAIATPDGDSYFSYVMPGILVMTMFFGLESTMAGVFQDASRGITDRFRTMPIASGAVVGGRCIADMLNSVVGLVVVVIAGYVLGWRWPGGPLPAIQAFGVLMLLRFAVLWVGIYGGLSAGSTESLAAVQILVWPASFLSNIFVDPATMPRWLGAIAAWNPLSATTATIRTLAGTGMIAADVPAGHVSTPGITTLGLEHSAILAVVWPVVLAMIFFPLAVRRYRDFHA